MIDPVTGGIIASGVAAAAPEVLKGFKNIFNMMSEGNRRRWFRNHPDKAKYYAERDPEAAQFIAKHEPELYASFNTNAPLAAPALANTPGTLANSPQGNWWSGYNPYTQQITTLTPEQQSLQNEQIRRLMENPAEFQRTGYEPIAAPQPIPYNYKAYEPERYNPVDLNAIQKEEIGRYERELLPRALEQAYGKYAHPQSGSGQSEVLRKAPASLTERLNALRAKNELQQAQFGHNANLQERRFAQNSNTQQKQFGHNTAVNQSNFAHTSDVDQRKFLSDLASRENQFKYGADINRESNMMRGAYTPAYEQILMPGKEGFGSTIAKYLTAAGVDLASEYGGSLLKSLVNKASGSQGEAEQPTVISGSAPDWSNAYQNVAYNEPLTNRLTAQPASINSPLQQAGIPNASVYDTVTSPVKRALSQSQEQPRIPELSSLNEPVNIAGGTDLYGKFLRDLNKSQNYALGGARRR